MALELSRVRLSDQERDELHETMARIIRAHDITEPFALRFDPHDDRIVTIDMALGRHGPGSETQMRVNMLKAFHDILEIKKAVWETEELREQNARRQKENSLLLGRLIDKVLPDHPQRDLLKELLSP